ncbi:hypothetical protein TTHERM_00430150 (macronuclear) [Tetrahymena thermophila SB210]|uniref:Uncharacterized protein n=1 Tax=Tetrahymena thermophila (strain SB210) TaxID=312017 RepID=Q231E5_TETTS|nr:hypothetical protein TTHERM_00430150 [Tetrahymena thermophila SB210]EAR91094.2 hypothetical protein TTHERM_00430150 [Tetrahymena thermophila SB210]|eukprot:XP_001011339.2 hypothetical protein TTHERM_00430150 [Tetrahymena thermophila SB210]
MKLNSDSNKPRIGLTQDQVFQNEYLSYLKQLSKEEDLNLMSEIIQPELFNINEISSFKEQLIQNKFQPLQLNFPIEKGFDVISNSLQELDNKIVNLEQQLCIGEKQNGVKDEEIQNLRTDYFLDNNRLQLNRLEFNYAKLKEGDQKCNYQQTQKSYPVQAQILQFSHDLYQKDHFSLDNDLQQKIQFHMVGQSLKEIGDLVKLDQSLNAWKKQLQNIKMFTLNLYDLHKKSTFLSLLRYLISIKSNVLCIQDIEIRDRYNKIKKKKGIKNSEAFELLDEAYQICLKNRNLQSLEIISSNPINFDSFLSAMTNVDLAISNICFLSLKINDVNVEQQQLCTFFSCLKELQYLQHLTLNSLKISEQETLNSLNQVLKKQKYITLQISYLSNLVDLNLNLEQAQFLNLQIDLAESQLTKKQQLNLFVSLQRARHLISIELDIYHDQGSSSEQEKQQQNNQVVQQQENKKEKKINGTSQKINNTKKQNQSKKQKGKEKVAGEIENLNNENFEIDDKDLLQLFLDSSTKLESYDVKIKYSPLIFKILILQLKNSQHLQQMQINFQSYDYIDVSQIEEVKDQNIKNKSTKQMIEQEVLEMDLLDMFAVLKKCQKLDLFKLKHDCIYFEYFKVIKDIDLYSLRLKINPKYSNIKQVLLFKNQFSFDFDKLKRVSITSPYDIDDLMIIDNLCRHLSACPKVESIKLNLFDDYSTKICREKQNYEYDCSSSSIFNNLNQKNVLEEE